MIPMIPTPRGPFSTSAPTDPAVTAQLAALGYDSGLRNVTALATNVDAGNLYVQRIGSTTWLIADQLRLKAGITGSSIDLLPNGSLPTGYRTQATRWVEVVTGTGLHRRLALTAGGWVPIYGTPQPGEVYYFTIPFPTPGPVPTTLPGSPA